MMKSTGVIRRIDDLGRIVITKEYRRKLSIHEGDPLEIFEGDGFIAFKKYNPTKSVRSLLEHLKNEVRDEPALENKVALLKKLQEVSELLDQEENSAAGGAV